MGIFDTLKKLADIDTVVEKNINIKKFNEITINDYFRAYLFQVLIDDFQCEWISTTSTPVLTTTTQNIDYMHTQVRQAGRTTPGQWQVTVRDDAKGNAFKYFHDWRELIYPNIPISSDLTPKRYKRSVNIKLIPPTGSNEYRLYNLIGVWPIELGSTTLDYDQEGIFIFPVTLSFDFFTVSGIGGGIK